MCSSDLMDFSPQPVKWIMLGLGMEVDPTGKPTSAAHRRHVGELWWTFHDFVATRGGARYLGSFPEGEPFADWSIHDRYAHRSHVTRDGLRRHREAANRIAVMAEAEE